MRVLLENTDTWAKNLVDALGGIRPKEAAGGVAEYSLEGGGRRLVIVFSLPEEGMTLGKKKVFSLKVGGCNYPLPEWVGRVVGPIDEAVVLVINRDRPDQLANVAKGQILPMLQKHTREFRFPPGLRGRGGYIVFTHLPPERVILEPRKVCPGEPNIVFQALTNFTLPPVVYGTSDAANIFELLQTLKAASFLELPAVFFSYDAAHCVGDYLKRILNPSLGLFGGRVNPEDLGLAENDKFTAQVRPELVLRVFPRVGLCSIASFAAEEAQASSSFADWYRRAMAEAGRKFLNFLGLKVPFKLVSLERILALCPVWQMKATQYALRLKEAVQHDVNAFNKPDGTQIPTHRWSQLPPLTVAELHERGWWLSGAGIHWFLYNLGLLRGTMVFIVKDSIAGNVHLLAKPIMEAKGSGLYVVPVGLFRMHAKGQAEDASIDPWVFLELVERWGERAAELVRQIWEGMKIPLKPEEVGQKTTITIGVEGAEKNIGVAEEPA